MNKYFARHEFECKCGCGFDSIDAETLEVLMDLRKHFNSPVTINSGCRCDSYNRQIGGSEHSQHKRARACDIKIRFIGPSLVADYLEDKYPDKYGIGRYDSFTHIDTRQVKARW